MKDKAPKGDVTPEISEIIEMAWCDFTSFDAIEHQTGKQEKEGDPFRVGEVLYR